jgi:alpha/beta superfamily hydrolase
MPLREIPGPVGPLEALLDEPPAERRVTEDGLLEAPFPGGVRAAVAFAHPHPRMAARCTRRWSINGLHWPVRCAVLWFNFRGAMSAGSFDGSEGEKDDSGRRWASQQPIPGRTAWAAGMSFGSWVALTAGS